MKKSLTIRIPEPCHEDWQKMTATEKGKFCQVCTKEVIDFTAKTDEEIVKYVSKNNNACGRFKADQLNREVKLERKSIASLAPYAASLLLPFTLLNANEMQAREVSEKPLISLGIGRFSENSEKSIIQTSGTITDTHGNPLTKVHISVKESGKSVESDNRGNYSISSVSDETLVFTLLGYDTQEVKRGRLSETLNLILSKEVISCDIIPMVVGRIAAPQVKTEQIENVQKDTIQTITISGTVLGERFPLPGTNVIVKGTDSATQTDFDGNYTIDVLPNQILVFSFIGFATQEITVSNISNIVHIEMGPEGYYGEVRLGGVSILVSDQYGNTIEPVDTKLLNEDNRAEWRNEIKEAYKNEIAFKKIKQARKKAARKLKQRNK